MTSIMDTDGGFDLIRADAKGRVLVPAAQREALLDAFERGGQSAMAFSRQHGIKYSTFANWIQCRRKKAGADDQRSVPAFTEVILDASPEAGDAAPVAESLRISLGNGIHVDVASRKHLPWVAPEGRLILIGQWGCAKGTGCSRWTSAKDGLAGAGAQTTDVGTAFSPRLFWTQVAKVE